MGAPLGDGAELFVRASLGWVLGAGLRADCGLVGGRGVGWCLSSGWELGAGLSYCLGWTGLVAVLGCWLGWAWLGLGLG